MNISLYYLITACQAAWFTESVWYFYFRQFTDYTTMGIIFAVLNIFWITTELPTGVLADKFGRKFATIVGTVFVTVGIAITGLANSIWIWIISLAIQDLGRSFISGALEALVYDDLKSRQQEARYARIASTKTIIITATYACAVVIGGYLGHINLHLPYFIFAFVSLISMIASFFLVESHKRVGHHAESSIHTTLQGIRQFKLPSLRPYLLLSWLLLFIYFVYGWGMIKPAMGVKFGYFEREQGVIYAISSILVVITLRQLPYLKRIWGELKGMEIFSLVIAAMFGFAIFPLGKLGFIPILVIELIGGFIDPWISTIMNQHIDSKYRATTLSALQMIGRAPYLLINPIIGNFIDHNKTNTALFILFAIMIIIIFLNRTLWNIDRKPATLNA